MDGSLHPVRYGRYLLLDRINVGGMAEVFRGKTAGVQGFERIVALKRILPNIAADPDFVQMFVEEAKLVVQLQHANIAQVYDLGEAEGTHYIAMEYVSGTDLRSMWDRARGRNRLLPIAMSCYIMQRVCEGLDAAHRKRDDAGGEISLVHRDVSPQNILISYEGEVKLIDFGIARAANRVSKTQAGVLKGKFGYMSPEQVRGVELDNRSDIFACGIVLYELLVGDRLFLGESDFSTLEKVRNVEMVPPTRLNKNLSPHLERIVMKALARTREDRYRWANEMAEDLQRYLFATNQPFARTDMQRYMQQHFRKEMGEERERLERYKQFSIPPDDEPMTQQHVAPELSQPVESYRPTAQSVTGTMLPGMLNPPPPSASISTVEPMAGDAPPPSYNVPPPLTGTNQPQGSFYGPSASHPQSSSYPQSSSQPQGLNHLQGALPVDANARPMNTAHSVVMGAPLPPQRAALPTWAAALIGALSVLLVGALVLLGYQTIWRDPPPGVLVVQSTPQRIELLIDGQLVASQTPFTTDNLPPETFELTARADGYKEVKRAVRIESGERRLEIIELSRRPGSASVIVRTNPEGLHVWINGRNTGLTTPATVTGLYAGEQSVWLRRDDGSLVHRFRMTLMESSAEVVEVDTRRLPALLDVTSEPPAARVEILGQQKGTTPNTIAGLKPGRVSVRVSKDGCLPVDREVRLAKATVTTVDVELDCRQQPTARRSVRTAAVTFTASTLADIYVDGEHIGRTPFFNHTLRVGKHSVRLVPVSGGQPAHEAEINVAVGAANKVHHAF